MLACVDPFGAAQPEALEALARHVTRVTRPTGWVALREGQPAEGLFIVLRGRVHVVRPGREEGRELILGLLGAGELFGERCVLEGSGAGTRVVAASPVDLARLPKGAVLGLLEAEPQVALRLARLLVRRIAELESVAGGLALDDVQGRLADTLVRLARRQTRGEGEPWVVAPVPTQAELARMVGSCRETVSRTLGQMARAGLLQAEGRRIVLSAELVGA